MPLYEFKCEICGEVIERVYKVAEKPTELTTDCPNCKGQSLFKSKVSAPSVMFSVFNPSQKLPSDFKNRMEEIRKNHPMTNSKYA